MKTLTPSQWIIQRAARLHGRRYTVGPDQLEEVAIGIWQDPVLRLMPPRRCRTRVASAKQKQIAATALCAIRQMHPAEYTRTAQGKLPAMFRTLDDVELETAIDYLQRVPDSWQFVANDTRVLLGNYVSKLPRDGLQNLDFLLEFEPLAKQAGQRVGWASVDDLDEGFFIILPEAVGDRYITLLFHAKSSHAAQEIARKISFDAEDPTEKQVRRPLTSPQSLFAKYWLLEVKPYFRD